MFRQTDSCVVVFFLIINYPQLMAHAHDSRVGQIVFSKLLDVSVNPRLISNFEPLTFYRRSDRYNPSAIAFSTRAFAVPLVQQPISTFRWHQQLEKLHSCIIKAVVQLGSHRSRFVSRARISSRRRNSVLPLTFNPRQNHVET